MSRSEIKILISAVDKASGALKKVGQSVGGLKGKLSGLSDVAKVAAGMLIRDLAQGLGKAFGEAVELGGQIDTLKASFDSMKNSLGATNLSLESLKEATKGTVSDVELLKAANQAMALGLPVEDLDEMFGAAMKLGHAMGIDTKAAVTSLSTGIGRQSKLILDNLGVVFAAQDAYDWYARQLGVTSDMLTETQKKLGWQKYAMKMVKDKADELGDTISEAQIRNEQWSASMTNLQTSIGQMLGPLGSIAPAIQGFMPLIGTLVGTSLPQLGGAFLGFAGKAVAAIKMVGVAMMTNPILLVITLIVGALVALYFAWENNWGGIRDVFQSVGGALMSGLQTLADFIMNPQKALEALSNAFGGLFEWFQNLPEPIKWLIRILFPVVLIFEHWDEIVRAVTGAIEWLTNALKPLTDALKPVTDALGGIASALFGSPKTIFEDAAVGVAKLKRQMRGLEMPGLAGPVAGHVGVKAVTLNVDARGATFASDYDVDKLMDRIVWRLRREQVIP